MEHVLVKPARGTRLYAWDPCAGEGHMSEVLKEYFFGVYESDVHDYGVGHKIGSFVGEGPDVIPRPRKCHWVIANPPFNVSVAFFMRAWKEADHGVALLLRTNWLEGQSRYQNVFKYHPPTVAVFSERVPMCKGRWDPDGSTATSYAWFIWSHKFDGGDIMWVPPGQRTELERPGDRRKFAYAEAETNLLTDV